MPKGHSLILLACDFYSHATLPFNAIATQRNEGQITREINESDLLSSGEMLAQVGNRHQFNALFFYYQYSHWYTV